MRAKKKIKFISMNT